MPIELAVITLRYSSWSMRPWLALTHAGADFQTRTAEIQLEKQDSVGGVVQAQVDDLEARRAQGSVTGLWPVLHVDGVAIHEALAICEYAAERYPEADLWPSDPMRRAQARSFACEMATGFPNLREFLSCHPFARVPDYTPNPASQREIDRVFEIWDQCLEASGGPFLFGKFGIVDCMYFPVITRFATYGVVLPPRLQAYADEIWELPAVLAWRELALRSPRMNVYDDAILALGGDPDGALPAGDGLDDFGLEEASWDGPPEEWPRASEVLVAYASPLGVEDMPPETMQQAIAFAVSVWTAVVLADENADDGSLDDFREPAVGAAEAEIAEFLINRKRMLFPKDRRLMVVDFTASEGQVGVQVSWRLP